MSIFMQSAQQYLRRYYQSKQKLQLPLKISLYFTLLQTSFKNNVQHNNTTNYQGVSQLLYRTFCQLSVLQKSFYLYSNMESIRRQYQKIKNPQGYKISNIIQSGMNITTSGQICQSKFGFSYWSMVKIILNYQNRKIKLQTKNRNIIIDLRLYLIRKSKKYKDTFILQTISDIILGHDKKIYLYFKNVIFQQIYNQILKCIINFRNQQLLKIVLEELSNIPNINQVSYIGINSKTVTFLNSKNVNGFLHFKEEVVKKVFKSNINYQCIYNTNNCRIDRQKQASSSISDHLYKLQSNYPISKTVLKKLLIQKYRQKNYKYLIQLQQLQKFSNKYTTIYQKMLFKTKSFIFHVIQQIVIQQINYKEEVFQNQFVIFQKGLNGVKFNGFLSFLIVKIKGIGNNNSQLIVIGSFKNEQPLKKYQKSKTVQQLNQQKQIITMFLLQFNEMIIRNKKSHENIFEMLQQLKNSTEKHKQNPQNQFITVQGNFKNHNQIVMDLQDIQQKLSSQFNCISPIQNKFHPKCNNQHQKYDVGNQDHGLSFTFNNKQIQMAQSNTKQTTYLNHRYQMQTSTLIQGVSIQKQVQKKHFLYDEWYRKPKGGLTCKDNTIINQQKKVANYILGALGQNLLQQKGSLLNISLPVTIFKAESHLYSIAKNLSFAPIILEKAVKMNPVQRVKLAAIYALSVSVSSISVNKPFNPILGETLQVWIDGCPAYLEQISHHPPIVSYYMIGRGYKLHGCIGPKVTVGFNSIIGYTQQPNFIEFDDGTIIELSFGKMIISGILLGQRTFNFQDKMYVIDSKNRLFCEICLKDANKIFFTKLNESEDMLNGKIVEITNQFIKIFDKKITYPNKNNIIKQLSRLEGIWNGKIKFDKQQYIDFQQSNGCIIQMEKYPLPSDSRYRKDIQYLKQGCVNASQNQKEKLENSQRRDQKLRKQLYHSNSFQ